MNAIRNSSVTIITSCALSEAVTVSCTMCIRFIVTRSEIRCIQVAARKSPQCRTIPRKLS
jgi:hypothetical protein